MKTDEIAPLPNSSSNANR